MKHVTQDLHRYLAGDLAPDAVGAFEAHVAACPDCARALAEERRLWTLLGELADRRQTASGDVSRSIWPAVRARTIGAARPAGGLLAGRPVLGWSLAGAAVVAGLVLGLVAPSGLLGTPDRLTGATGDNTTASVWLSDGSWLSDNDADGLDLVWATAGLNETGEGS